MLVLFNIALTNVKSTLRILLSHANRTDTNIYIIYIIHILNLSLKQTNKTKTNHKLPNLLHLETSTRL